MKQQKIYEKLGDEPRATAYHNLAKRLELMNLDGITEKSKQKIKTIEKTGQLPILEKLKSDKKIQARLKLSEILGVGPKLAENLADKGYKNFNDFKRNYKNLTKMQKVGVDYYSRLKLKPSLEVLHELVRVILGKVPKIENLAVAGSYRTGNPNPNDIDLIVCSRNGKINPLIQVLEKLEILVGFHQIWKRRFTWSSKSFWGILPVRCESHNTKIFLYLFAFLWFW